MPEVPLYDDAGINLADPHDANGHKTAYISHLQLEALRRLLAPVSGVAADVGCGYGRMTSALHRLGFDRVIGIDPSARVIEAARRLSPEIDFRVGALPSLPLALGEVGTVFILNVLRALHLQGITDVASGAALSLSPGGRLVVLDNLRKDHPDYLKENDVLALFESVGLRLVARESIRGARWPWVPMLKFGLVPHRLYPLLASFELAWMKMRPTAPRWQYINVIWVFEKP
jgi:SAM-dependent methyltransferase